MVAKLTIVAPNIISDIFVFFPISTVQFIKISAPFVINTNNNVEISFLIDKSTEKSFDIPITLINVPENINIRTFPTSINIKFSVSIQNYNNVLPSMFEANIDYNTISNVSKTTQKVNIQYNSNIYITNLTSTPKEVEYVIETMQ